MSEAQWLPSSKTEMAVIGPIVRNELFFFVFIFGAAALLVLREWQSASHSAAAQQVTGPAERRLLEAQNRRQRNWMIAAASACLVVILALTADFIYARAGTAPPTVAPIAAQGDELRVPLAQVQDGAMHLYSAEIAGSQTVFMIIKKPDGWGTALDACRICGAEGYRQDGQSVVCRHCGSAIYVPSIGQTGGCNPIGVPAHVDGSDLVLNLSSLTQATKEIPK
jgi:uncharacterized membrane protein